MTGDRLLLIARRMLRDDTCTRVVIPAIADLQYEGTEAWIRRARGYIGVWRAMAGGLGDELAWDFRITFAGPPVRQALMHSALNRYSVHNRVSPR